MEIEYFFNDETIPIIIHKFNDKCALFDTRTRKHLTKLEKQYFDTTDYNAPGKWYKETNGKILLIQGNKNCFLFINNVQKFHTENNELSYFTMNPNDKYICVQNKEKGECIIEIDTQKRLTPYFSSIYPSPNFPKNFIYKARENSKESIFHYPENKSLIGWHYDVSSAAVGMIGGINDFYYTIDSYRLEQKYWMAWNIPILHSYPIFAKKLFGDLDKKILRHSIIKRVFKI